MLKKTDWAKRLLALVLCFGVLLGLTACAADSEATEPSVTEPTQTEETTPATEEVNEPTQATEPASDEITLNVTPSADPGNPLPFRQLSVEEIVAEMGTGWNLGNTMDGHSGFTPNETLWQDHETTQELINAVHDLGFNTVRIPITWGTMINDDYSINDKWISRVQDIVDYCINQDMYVIINIHHDGAEQSGWLRVAAEDLQPVYEKFAGVWTSIATYFRDYDEHLIFESMNEVTGDSSTSVEQDTAVIMELNQIFVNVVRSSGSNNEQRWLSVPGRYTNVEHMTGPSYGFDLPEDTVENRIFASVHYYDLSFGLSDTMTTTTFDESRVKAITNAYEKLVTRFTSQGIPVIMGEYGAMNKNNPEWRAYHNEVFNVLAKNSGVVNVYWDQGWYDRTQEPADYSYALIDRETYETVDTEVTEGLMRGYFVTGDVASVVLSPEVIAITDVALDQTDITLTIGDAYHVEATAAPENTNDVLLWKTSDYTVATVYNGMIRARGIGSATITAFSQSGSVEKTITVTVQSVPSGDLSGVEITVPESVTVEEGKYTNLGASINAGADVYLTYASQDPNIATVNKLGKIVGIAPGTTEVFVTASNGMWTSVSVTVTQKPLGAGLQLALNVLFNDNDLSYFGNEIGEVITIYEDGQYTLTFDCAQHLSATATDLGVTGMNNLTAIYIKDYAVTSGESKKSNLVSCNITWDKIVVDGVELTIVNGGPKSAIKASGILDTNDPFNSWDGSAVAEVTVDNHVLNINLENPQTVTITFTISDLEFAE